MIAIRRLACVLALTALAGCGDGSGDSAAPVARVVSARTIPAGATLMLDGSASSGPAGLPLTYRWTLTGRPAGSAASLVAADSAHPIITADVEGDYLLTLVVGDGRTDSAPVTTSVAATAALATQIVADQSEPFAGTVGFRLQPDAGALPVTWFVDLVQIGAGPTVTYDTAMTTSGSHLVLARVAIAADAYVEVRRTVVVGNPPVRVTTQVYGADPVITVDVRAMSASGIVSVAATLDGAPLGTLTAPNGCSIGTVFCVMPSQYDVFRFTIDTVSAGSGPHTVSIVATDRTGSVRQISVSVPISNLPVVTVASPADGALVYPMLTVGGTVSSDIAGPVTVTASVGDVQFLTTTAANFSGAYDLSQVPAGPYTVTIRATDSANQTTVVQRPIFVTSSAALAYRPVVTAGPNGTLLAADGDRFVYVANDLSVRMHDAVTGSEVVLAQAASLSQAHDWQIVGTTVVASDSGDVCGAGRSCILRWDASGAIANLSDRDPQPVGRGPQAALAHGSFVVWFDTGGGYVGAYTLYDLATDTIRDIAPPPGVTSAAGGFDFTVSAGNVELFYPAASASSGMGYDIYRWDGATNGTTRLTIDGAVDHDVVTDGVRVAWLQSAIGPYSSVSTLLSQAVASGPPAVVATQVDSRALGDGVLAWRELSGSVTGALRASTTTATSTLTSSPTAMLYGTSGGTVVYGQDGRLYSWNSSTKASTLRLDFAPLAVFPTESVCYVEFGPEHVIYRIPLD